MDYPLFSGTFTSQRRGLSDADYYTNRLRAFRPALAQALTRRFDRRIEREYSVQSRYMERLAHRSVGPRQTHFSADFRDASIGVDEAADAGGIDVRDFPQIEDEML